MLRVHKVDRNPVAVRDVERQSQLIQDPNQPRDRKGSRNLHQRTHPRRLRCVVATLAHTCAHGNKSHEKAVDPGAFNAATAVAIAAMLLRQAVTAYLLSALCVFDVTRIQFYILAFIYAPVLR